MRIVHACMMLLLMAAASLAVADEGSQAVSLRFEQMGDSVVHDLQTGLMWAARDNGSDIDWYDAQAYCKEFTAGGYDDWRLPDIKELATLYSPENRNRDGYFITDAIRITECCMWSSYETMGGSLAFSFKSGKKPAASLGETYQLRVLPVRSGKKTELPE